MNPAARLFDDPDFVKKLAYLDLVAKQLLAGTRRGERRSARPGSGTLFRDHRSYSRGDDLRYVDWNVYGRLDSLFVKQFEVEESADVLLLLDRSLSMDHGTPGKLAFARRLAAALGYVGLAHLDRVEVLPLPGEEEGRSFTGRAQARDLFHHLLRVEPRGETDLLGAVRRIAARRRRHGVAVLLSDLLDPRGYRRAVDYLLHRRYEVFLVQVYAPEEAAPPHRGPLRLADAETGRRLAVHLTEETAAAYRRVFREFCAGVSRYARSKGIGHARFSTDTPFGPAALSVLSRGGVVR